MNQPESAVSNKSAESKGVAKVEADKKAQKLKCPGSPAVRQAYKDYSHLTDDDKELTELLSKADSEGVKGTDQTFPVKLHQLLSGSDADGFSSIVCWQPHGRSFIVKKHQEFVDTVLPWYVHCSCSHFWRFDESGASCLHLLYYSLDLVFVLFYCILATTTVCTL